MKKLKINRKAFTLIEMLLVLLIISLLLILIIPN
ncbi:prepilin-type N-terminal cleavage/methylation domain-containing protein, partial [Staphylococcus saprophyticus]